MQDLRFEVMDEPTYRQHPAFSNTDLSNARKLRMGVPLRKRSQPLRVGSLVHELLLEPESWQECSKHVPQQELRHIERLAAAARCHPRLSRWLADPQAQREVSAFWTDAHTGLPCKARADLYLPGSLLVDLKTTSCGTSERFRKDAFRYDYDRQLVFYLQAFQAPEALLAGISKPKRGQVILLPLDEEMRETGTLKMRSLLEQLAADEALQQQVRENR